MSGVDGFDPLPSDSAKEHRDKDRIGEALRTAIPDWVRTGRMVKGVRIDPSSEQNVQHGLKRIPSGWVVMSPRCLSAGSTMNDMALIERAKDASTIRLQFFGTAAILFDLWVW